jgi:hypothetical protein
MSEHDVNLLRGESGSPTTLGRGHPENPSALLDTEDVGIARAVTSAPPNTRWEDSMNDEFSNR